MVDTLRADHLGLYGYERDTTPVLDRRSEAWVVFERAYSQAACTYPSVASLLTSRLPGRFHPETWGDWSIPEEHSTLPELLREAGYSTVAVSASTVVRKSPSQHNRTGGYDRGFLVFDETCTDREAACINERAAAYLSLTRLPVFLYLHYMEPHNPYSPPPEHRRRFVREKARKQFVRRGNIGSIARMLYLGGDPVAIDAHDRRHLADLYDEEIAYFDSSLEHLLDVVDSHLPQERTLIVLASDHGEVLFEHGDLGHCRNLIWESVLRVPLALRIPGVAGARIEAVVQNLDLAPTIVDYLALEDTASAFEGESLRPLIEGREGDPGYAFAAEGRFRAVMDERFKLVLDVESGTRRLFDLDRDPHESADLASERPDVARRLSRALSAWIRRQGDSADPERTREIQKQLDALGYL